jgi:hypothetical protein
LPWRAILRVSPRGEDGPHRRYERYALSRVGLDIASPVLSHSTQEDDVVARDGGHSHAQFKFRAESLRLVVPACDSWMTLQGSASQGHHRGAETVAAQPRVAEDIAASSMVLSSAWADARLMSRRPLISKSVNCSGALAARKFNTDMERLADRAGRAIAFSNFVIAKEPT